MKKLLLSLCLLLPLFSFGQQTDTTSINDTTPQVYIPKDLEDCMRQLDSVLSAEDKAYIQKEGASAVHFSLGMWMRNNWGLWRGSRLQTYFTDNGIHHPDDMSGVILDCYVKHLRGEKVKYKRMLHGARKAEEKWQKKMVKQERERQKKAQKEWEYGGRYKCEFDYDTIPFDSSTAFLHLPITIDSLTGTQIRYRQRGEPLEEELELVKRDRNRPPRRAPRPDELVNFEGKHLKGRVKHLEEDSEDGRYHDEYDFTPDGTLVSHLCGFRHIDSTHMKFTHEEYTYTDGRLTETRTYIADTLNKITRYVYNEKYMISITDNDSILYLLSPEGKPLFIYYSNGYSYIFEYDSLGRNVNHLEYRGDTLHWWTSLIFDDSLGVMYEIGNHYPDESYVECHVMNEQGDELGECCPQLLSIFNRKKTLYSYRYDKQGNWTHRYYEGEDFGRRKITYYK